MMYEIWSLGKKPFPSLTNEQVNVELTLHSRITMAQHM